MGKVKYPLELKGKVRMEYTQGGIASELAKKYGINGRSIYSFLGSIPKHKKQRPIIKIKLNKDEKYYAMLGLVYGDGWVTKYTVGFCSKDKEMVGFVANCLSENNIKYRVYKRTVKKGYVISGIMTKNDSVTYHIRVNSMDLCNKMREDFGLIGELEGIKLEKFIDGLLCAEGSVQNSHISFAQNEPEFSKLVVVINKYLGKENQITQNQNGCKQAHWSLFDVKDKNIFTICERKRILFLNNSPKYSRNSIRGDIIGCLNKNKIPQPVSEILRLSGRKDYAPTQLLLNKMVEEGLLNKQEVYFPNDYSNRWYLERYKNHII